MSILDKERILLYGGLDQNNFDNKKVVMIDLGNKKIQNRKDMNNADR